MPPDIANESVTQHPRKNLIGPEPSPQQADHGNCRLSIHREPRIQFGSRPSLGVFRPPAWRILKSGATFWRRCGRSHGLSGDRDDVRRNDARRDAHRNGARHQSRRVCKLAVHMSNRIHKDCRRDNVDGRDAYDDDDASAYEPAVIARQQG